MAWNIAISNINLWHREAFWLAKTLQFVYDFLGKIPLRFGNNNRQICIFLRFAELNMWRKKEF